MGGGGGERGELVKGYGCPLLVLDYKAYRTEIFKIISKMVKLYGYHKMNIYPLGKPTCGKLH